MERSTNPEPQHTPDGLEMPDSQNERYAPNADSEEDASVIIDLEAIRGQFNGEMVMIKKSTGNYAVIPKSEADELKRKWDEKTPPRKRRDTKN